MKTIDHEEIFQLTFHKRWNELLKLVYEYSKENLSDELLTNAVKTCEDQFFLELDKGVEEDKIDPLKQFVILHKGRIYELSEDRFGKAVVELVKIYDQRGLRKEAYEYSKFYPKHEICSKIINSYEESLPKVVEHSQSNQIRVTENHNIASADHTTSLFKSRQEIEFFRAAREVYQSYVVYPNVALSCVINFEKIKNKLSQEERSYFFTAIIDCVVFDQHNNYKPTKFFELDSHYHDSHEQQKKDSYKDNIIGRAGHRLYRVRKTSDHQGFTEFVKLIKEMVD